MRRPIKNQRKMGRAKKVRLLETNDANYAKEPGLLYGEYGSEGAYYGGGYMHWSITKDGIKRERELRKKMRLPK